MRLCQKSATWRDSVLGIDNEGNGSKVAGIGTVIAQHTHCDGTLPLFRHRTVSNIFTLKSKIYIW